MARSPHPIPPADFAALVGVSPIAVRKWCARPVSMGGLPHSRVARRPGQDGAKERILIDRAAGLAWVKANRVTPITRRGGVRRGGGRPPKYEPRVAVASRAGPAGATPSEEQAIAELAALEEKVRRFQEAAALRRTIGKGTARKLDHLADVRAISDDPAASPQDLHDEAQRIGERLSASAPLRENGLHPPAGSDVDPDALFRLDLTDLARWELVEKVVRARLERLELEGSLIDAAETERAWARAAAGIAQDLRRAGRLIAQKIVGDLGLDVSMLVRARTIADAELDAVASRHAAGSGEDVHHGGTEGTEEGVDPVPASKPHAPCPMPHVPPEPEAPLFAQPPEAGPMNVAPG